VIPNNIKDSVLGVDIINAEAEPGRRILYQVEVRVEVHIRVWIVGTLVLVRDP